MANIMDYLAWRGDLTFEQDSFNEVDALILSELAYLDFTDIVKTEPLLLAEAADIWFEIGRNIELEQTALFQAHTLGPLLRATVQAPRFAEVKLCHFARRVDLAQSQFQACTFLLGKPGIYVGFSGTDDTLAGWEEDFRISFEEEIPAQRDALAYFGLVAASCPRQELLLGGHSKGGNLAVYAAAECLPDIRHRIKAVYNQDGPGFREGTLKKPGYRAIRSRIHSFVPQSSIVGLLLEHEAHYAVVESTQRGLLQHDGFSWEVERNAFVRLPEKTAQMIRREQTLQKVIGELTIPQRETFTDAVFRILSLGGSMTTTTELRDEGLKVLKSMWKTYEELDSATRAAVNQAVSLFFSESWQGMLEELRGKDAAPEWLDKISETLQRLKAGRQENEKEE